MGCSRPENEPLIESGVAFKFHVLFDRPDDNFGPRTVVGGITDGNLSTPGGPDLAAVIVPKRLSRTRTDPYFLLARAISLFNS
ncbi:Hypothetical protein NTJ_06366 [Nesidiocoris tenuis]|uniref:Uncharacterized protein n=1 Tax=Nesidiocoris tenuis TaxID=355587 RepID=A0ABN7AQF7_9HEMI|nr:Hypothetical protein NTJ_06366 [Nesidiocoris tenuis]